MKDMVKICLFCVYNLCSNSNIILYAVYIYMVLYVRHG